ncbi:putative RNA 2'-phosphotransferase [Kribbella aluminosa]|uniref:RNA 2'-phosphotransferase n=2 Tax=Kribbella aluminosa TaxID=416017 RepID=A0ABS4UF09_9ACTN|nr:putative RNA 2'-phosphotransferase [Kribbella aluminosa]
MSMDGWAAITDVLRVLQLTRERLGVAVRENDKRRLQVDGERIRACQGLRAGRRTHVHLAAAKDSRVGRRTSVEVLLGVDPGNLAVYRAPNGVLLTREVPPDAIVGSDAVH